VLFKLMATTSATVIVFTDSDTRRESYIHGGWNLADDDAPRPPDVDPLASAQARRYWLQSSPAAGHQSEAHSRHVPQDAAVAGHT
jgi:hypothetical protein